MLPALKPSFMAVGSYKPSTTMQTLSCSSFSVPVCYHPSLPLIIESEFHSPAGRIRSTRKQIFPNPEIFVFIHLSNYRFCMAGVMQEMATGWPLWLPNLTKGTVVVVCDCFCKEARFLYGLNCAGARKDNSLGMLPSRNASCSL